MVFPPGLGLPPAFLTVAMICGMTQTGERAQQTGRTQTQGQCHHRLTSFIPIPLLFLGPDGRLRILNILVQVGLFCCDPVATRSQAASLLPEGIYSRSPECIPERVPLAMKTKSNL